MVGQQIKTLGCVVAVVALALGGCADAEPKEHELNHEDNSISEQNNPDEGGEGLGVLQTVPEDGATSVSLGAPLRVRFDDELDAQSVVLGQSLRVNPSVDGQIEISEGSALEFAPAMGWSPSTTYRVTLTTDVTSAGGEALEEEVVIDFSTRAGEPIGQTGTYEANGETVRVSVAGEEQARRYTMTTTAALRDDEPADKRVEIVEQPGQPLVRTGSDVFDALFAMAIEETRQCSVSQISDGAFNNGQGVPCECFETGAKWNYVWTRDTAYAVDLGLAIVDPERARNSMNFKLSERKGGGGLQIVQDTGSGGSWPVSTDRVVWSIGARELLKWLGGDARQAFRDRTYEALVNTIEQDRQYVYSPEDGLYRGEQSFLDWREQSYPSWTEQDTVHLGMSRALSTNAGHHATLQLAADLAREKGLGQEAARYQGWADELAAAIEAELWLEGAQMYSALKTTGLDLAPLHKYDLLGESLVVLGGIAPEARARQVVAAYPHVAMGPPVLWPQQPLIPVYHNRGIWPFVTAYGLLAAREVGNASVFELDLASLIRGAALNLSNMENFEFTTQQPWYDDGPYSGPVVNSRRQLWSVAGYIGAIVKGVFGMEADQQGVRFAPFVTPGVHAEWFAGQESIELRDVTWRGRTFSVTVNLPEEPAGGGGAYTIEQVELNGQPAPQGFWGAAQLEQDNAVEITLGEPVPDAGQLTLVEDLDDFTKLWAPQEPTITDVSLQGDQVAVTFEPAADEGARFHIYRDGERVAEDAAPGTWVDPASGDWQEVTHCYAIEAYFPGSQNHSHHSRPACFWGEGAARVRQISAYGFEPVAGGSWSTMHDQVHYQDWGRPEHELALHGLRPRWTGSYRVQLVYGNGAGGFDTGITAAVKQLVFEDAETGEELERAVVQMPQMGDWSRWSESSLARVELEADRRYRVRIVDGINMSYFAHFVPYTGGQGGGEDIYNMTNIHSVKLLPMRGQLERPQAGDLVALDGQDDLSDQGPAQQVAPGAPLQEWSRWALSWDEDFLYVTLATEAFEDPYKPVMLYLGAAEQAASPGAGELEYSGQVAELPFAPEFLISARRLSDDGAAEGPWNGIWRWEQGGWVRQRRLAPGQQWWISADEHVLSMRVPLAALGAPERVRLVGHVVNAAAGNEWKELLPASHTPWMAGGGGYLELDLTQPTTPAEQWTRVEP